MRDPTSAVPYRSFGSYKEPSCVNTAKVKADRQTQSVCVHGLCGLPKLHFMQNLSWFLAFLPHRVKDRRGTRFYVVLQPACHLLATARWRHRHHNAVSRSASQYCALWGCETNIKTGAPSFWTCTGLVVGMARSPNIRPLDGFPSTTFALIPAVTCIAACPGHHIESMVSSLTERSFHAILESSFRPLVRLLYCCLLLFLC